LQLHFNSPYLSLDQFDPVEIPDFVVVTGVNGSGKSHLLEALEKRHVVISGMEQANIVLFNYETFRLDNEPTFNAHQLSAERESAWQYHEQQIKNNVHSWRSGLANYEPLKASCAADKSSFWSLPADELKTYKQNFKSYFNNPNIKQNPQAQGIFSLAKNIPYSIDEIRHDDFVRLYKPVVFKNDFLPHQLGKVFWDYYVKYRGNQVNAYENEKNGKNYEALSEQDFIKVHGEKPWDLINRILETFDTLKYKVNSPEGADYFGNFQLKLKHIEKENLEIEFSTLSSGEKILMALVASVYKSSGDKHFPDILLLDEVDASLHPSMMKNMLEVVKNIFLKQGVKVFLVTHSPTTIALAPEDSIYVVNRVGRNRIEKKSKQEALSILTQGFATIEEGLKLFDEVARSSLTIITEGKNTLLISKALQLHGINDIEVLSGVEGVSGKNQLKTLFDFLSRTNHVNKVIFVWDCDVTHGVQPSNNTYPYSLPLNEENTIAKNGIENIFPSSLFDNFKKIITLSNGSVITEFDSARKRDFENFVVERNDAYDFLNFSSLIAEIARVRLI
jgi:AAA15 family ATPase/GTPase